VQAVIYTKEQNVRYSLLLSRYNDTENEEIVVGSEFYGYELICVLIRVLVQMRDGDIITIKSWDNQVE
jgi:hypothetical protein